MFKVLFEGVITTQENLTPKVCFDFNPRHTFFIVANHTLSLRFFCLCINMLYIFIFNIYICCYSFNLIIMYKTTLPSYHAFCRTIFKKKITTSNQIFSANSIQYHLWINPGRDLKSNPRRKIGFYPSGNNINRRTLSGNYQMNANWSCKLCKSANRILYYFCLQHQISKFIYHNNYIWKTIVRILLIISDNVSTFILLEQNITFFHFSYQRFKEIIAFISFMYNWIEQKRNVWV